MITLTGGQSITLNASSGDYDCFIVSVIDMLVNDSPHVSDELYVKMTRMNSATEGSMSRKIHAVVLNAAGVATNEEFARSNNLLVAAPLWFCADTLISIASP